MARITKIEKAVTPPARVVFKRGQVVSMGGAFHYIITDINSSNNYDVVCLENGKVFLDQPMTGYLLLTHPIQLENTNA